MCKLNKKNDARRRDPCLKGLLEFINTHPSVKTLSSCCGHGRYNMTIVVKYLEQFDDKKEWKIMELLSRTPIPRKKRFYKKDKQGYYFIPECMERI